MNIIDTTEIIKSYLGDLEQNILKIMGLFGEISAPNFSENGDPVNEEFGSITKKALATRLIGELLKQSILITQLLITVTDAIKRKEKENA